MLAEGLRKNLKIFLLISSTTLWSCSSDDDPVIKKEDLQTELLVAINDLRANGCQCANDLMPPVNELSWNDTLQKAADDHVRDMYANGYFSHLSPDGTPPIG